MWESALPLQDRTVFAINHMQRVSSGASAYLRWTRPFCPNLLSFLCVIGLQAFCCVFETIIYCLNQRLACVKLIHAKL